MLGPGDQRGQPAPASSRGAARRGGRRGPGRPCLGPSLSTTEVSFFMVFWCNMLGKWGGLARKATCRARNPCVLTVFVCLFGPLNLSSWSSLQDDDLSGFSRHSKKTSVCCPVSPIRIRLVCASATSLICHERLGSEPTSCTPQEFGVKDTLDFQDD